MKSIICGIEYVRGLSLLVEGRKVGFTQHGKQIESLTPTLSALIEQAKRAVYEGGHVWGQCLVW